MLTPSPLAAAHSMDTRWFAVDRDGHVASFESGEDGAVPQRAASGGGAGEPSFDTWPVCAWTVAQWLARDGLARTADAVSEVVATVVRERSRVLIAYAREEDGDGARPSAREAEKRIPEAIRWVLREREPRIVASREPLDPAVIRAIDEEDGLVAVFDERAVLEHRSAWMGDEDSGLYEYVHSARDEGSGAYERRSVPEAPLSIAALDARTREALTGLVLPVRFEEQPAVQLADHMSEGECDRWGETPLRYDEAHPRPDWKAIAAARAAQREHDRRVLRRLALALLVTVSLIVALARR